MKLLLIVLLAALPTCLQAQALGVAFSGVITNPTPTCCYEEQFASKLAALGNQHVLVPVPFEGLIHLFATNGTLLRSFTNPMPRGRFGSERIIVSAPSAGNFFQQPGAVYLFSTTGTLLTTITNPNPNVPTSGFGIAVAGVGDHVLVGTPGAQHEGVDNAGLAYLFTTNGSLVTVFTNPGPANSLFARTLTMLGHDRVVIGAPFSSGTGAAYLFHTNGTLLQSFTSPEPQSQGQFGAALALVGHVLAIGAYRESWASHSEAGRVHLFKTNGVLLRTFVSPPPGFYAAGERFGVALASIGTNALYIGADRAWANGFGSVQAGKVFHVELRSSSIALTITRHDAEHVRLLWPNYPGFAPEVRSTPTAESNQWETVPPPYPFAFILSNGVYYRFFSATLPATNVQFFRLRQP
jgi:hypothetical protein